MLLNKIGHILLSSIQISSVYCLFPLPHSLLLPLLSFLSYFFNLSSPSSFFQVLTILLPTGWTWMLLWAPIRSHLWSTWPPCSASWPRKSWWSGPWPRYRVQISAVSKPHHLCSQAVYRSHLKWHILGRFFLCMCLSHNNRWVGLCCQLCCLIYNVCVPRIWHLKSSWMQESATLISGSPPNQASLEMRSTSSTACLATRWAEV